MACSAPTLSLFLKRDDTELLLLFDDFVKVVNTIGTAFRDDLAGAALAGRGGKNAGTGDGAYPRSFERPFFLSWNIHPPPYDPPFATLFNVACLSSAAGH
jgi:hypothetical protein